MALTINRLSFKAHPPKVVLLPDSFFFVRVIPVAPGAQTADVTSQVELALESLAPFPIAHLFYAHHWVPGAKSAVVYAAYRKRFANDESDAWRDAEVVIPRFAALLTTKVDQAGTVVLTAEDGVTAVHWGDGSDVPSQVITKTWAPDAGPAEKNQVRDELVRSLGGSKSMVDVTEPPRLEPDGTGGDFLVHASRLVGKFSREQLDALDIRDKEDLTARRRARHRDLLLWRAFLACVLGVVLAGVLEVALIGGKFWERSRRAGVERQAPVVAEIQRARSLAVRIDELSTKRLRPFEMVSLLGNKRPGSVVFLRATTRSLYTMEVEANASSPADVGVYLAALRQQPEIAKVDVERQGTRDGVSNFVMVVTFKPEAFSTARP